MTKLCVSKIHLAEKKQDSINWDPWPRKRCQMRLKLVSKASPMNWNNWAVNWFEIDGNWFENDAHWFEIDAHWFEIDLNIWIDLKLMQIDMNWFEIEYAMNTQWLHNDYVMITQWLCNDYAMIFKKVWNLKNEVIPMTTKLIAFVVKK